MADKKVILEVEVIEGNAQSTLNELNASLKSLDKTHKDYKPTLELIAQAERALAKAQQNRILAGKGLSLSTKKTAKEMKQLSSDTGAATSASLELGRVFSDAPYGIRGVANNIQQLASNLFFMSKKTDEATGNTVGFGGALKKLGTGLWGATGILVAFQAGIALLDYFKVGMEKAESSSSDFESSLTSLRKTLDDLGVSQEDMNEKIEDYIILQDLKKKTEKSQADTAERRLEIEEELIDVRRRNAESVKEQKLLLGDMTVAQYKALSEEEKIAHRKNVLQFDFNKRLDELAKYIDRESELEKEKRDIIKGSVVIQKEYNELKKSFNAAEKDSLKGLRDSKKEKEEERELLSKTSQEYKKLTIVIDEYQKKIDEITGGKKKKVGKVKKISPFKTPKELELDVKNNEKALIEFNKKLEEYDLKTEMNNKLSAVKTEKERFDIKKLYATKLLTAQIDAERETLKLNKSTELEIAKSKTAAHVADIKRAFELFKIKTELNKNLTPKQKESLIGGATGKMFDAIGQADKEIKATEKGINDRYKPIFKLFEEVKVARFAALFSGFKDKEKQEDELAKLKRYAKKAKEILNGIGDFVDAEYQRELSIEQNKTNVLNNELNQRLLNENLSKEQRKTIQNEIAQNDEKLRKKQESIEKKRFKAQKAINIATALIDTGVAAVKALKNNGGVPTGLPAMFGTIALGLAQVATIARTKFQSSAGSSPALVGGGSSSSSGSGTARAEPSFNIVGRSNNNQLLDAIQSQFDKPLKAYVVSGDVTNQQELDRNISSGASI